MIAEAIVDSDCRPLTAEQQQLVAETYPAALREAAVCLCRANVPRRLHGELDGAVAEGLCRAALRFDPAIARWNTYWPIRVRGALKDELRKLNAKGFGSGRAAYDENGTIYVQSLADPIPGFDDFTRTIRIQDVLEDDSEPVGWELEYEGEVRRLAGLAAGPENPECREALESLYLRADRPTMKTAGLAAGISKSRVSQIHSKMIVAGRRRAARATQQA